MEKFVICGVLIALCTVVIAFPADHRDDTVVPPYGLNNGNGNQQDIYYTDKYPQPGNAPDAHAIFRTKREPSPQNHHNQGHGHYQEGGHGQYGHQPTYNNHQYGQHHNPHQSYGHHHGKR